MLTMKYYPVIEVDSGEVFSNIYASDFNHARKSYKISFGDDKRYQLSKKYTIN